MSNKKHVRWHCYVVIACLEISVPGVQGLFKYALPVSGKSCYCLMLVATLVPSGLLIFSDSLDDSSAGRWMAGNGAKLRGPPG